MPSKTITIVEEELAKPWFRRADPGLKALHDVRREPARLSYARLTIVILGVFFSLNTVLDFLLVSDFWRLVLWNHLVVAPAVVSVVVYRSYRRRARAAFVEREVAGAIVLATAMFCTPILLTEHRAEAVNYFTAHPVLFVAAAIFGQFPLRLAVATSAGVFLIMLATLIALADGAPQIILPQLCSLVWLPILLLVIRWRMEQETYRTFLHAVKMEAQKRIIAASNDELARLSTTDALTGLRNRRSIDEALRTSWRALAAGGPAFAVILVDVDFFKRFNDAYGHQGGDSCLIQVARAVDAVVTVQGGVVGRYGGEEFMAIAPIDDPRAAAALGDTICRSVARLGIPHGARGDGCGIVSISLGVALTGMPDVTGPERLVTDADAALYRAKADGRNRCCLYGAGTARGLAA